MVGDGRKDEFFGLAGSGGALPRMVCGIDVEEKVDEED